MPPRRLLLDTASLYFRAYYGVPARYALDGTTPVNAVTGLLNMIATFVRETHPDEVAACWDNDWRPNWRVALVDTYKSHRVAGSPSGFEVDPRLPVGAGGRGAESGVAEIADPALSIQVPLIASVLRAAGVPMVGADGYEADDVIGSLAVSAAGPVDVVTGDRDLFQLVRQDVRVLYVARGISRYETVDDAWLTTRYGVTGSQYVDFSVLRGDASDGLPGVAGIGEKTAARLLSQHRDLEGVLADPGLSPRLAAKLATSMDYIGRARQVVAVRTDLRLTGDLTLPQEVSDAESFERLTRDLALGSAADRLVEAMRGR